MLPEFIVMFRESLEVAFVIGIILAYLHKTKNSDQEKHVWLGLIVGILLSISFAFGFSYLQGGFDAHEAFFEGIFMIITAVLVTWLLLWISEKKNIVQSLQNEVKFQLEKKERLGLFLLAISATLREGVESVLFLAGISVNTGSLSLMGAFFGIVAAVIVGVLVFEYAIRFNIGGFFKITNVLLLLLAAGLFSRGLAELQEVHFLPTWVAHVYDFTPQLNSDGSYPLLHEQGVIGSILKGLVGYSTSPSDLQVLGYFSYLGLVYLIQSRK